MRDKIQHWLLKVMMVLFVAEVLLSWVAQVFSSISTIHLVLVILVVSGVAYVVRSHRNPRQIRPRSTSTGERTPMMPRSGR